MHADEARGPGQDRADQKTDARVEPERVDEPRQQQRADDGDGEVLAE
jgi:hypothetical protein